MKRRKAQPKVCPQCGNTDIVGCTSLDGFVLPTRFLCRKCGYSGHLVIEPGESPKKEKTSDRA